MFILALRDTAVAIFFENARMIQMKIVVLNNFAVGKNHLGKAVFAARPFKKGEVITQFTGPILHKSKIPKKYTEESDRYMQISPDTFLGPSGKIDDLINHSCDPNAGMRFTDSGILLTAIKPIKTGDEITWDYSTTMLENTWNMKCDCRKKSCRKIVGDFILLEPKLQEKYRKMQIIPEYIKNYMDSKEYAIYTKGIARQRKYERTKK